MNFGASLTLLAAALPKGMDSAAAAAHSAAGGAVTGVSFEKVASSLFVFMLSTFLGLEVIRRVSPLLHTPLMSLTNAISAIAVIAAIQVMAEAHTATSTFLCTIAIIAATTNIVGGFMITDRMLKMFKREPKRRE